MPVLTADARHTVTITLNGKVRTGTAHPRLPLSDFLRHELGAHGTRVGCEHGVCGFRTFAACRPFGPCVTSNSTRSPSFRVRNPSMLMAVWWTNTSSPPS